jgi:hypothetical protein
MSSYPERVFTAAAAPVRSLGVLLSAAAPTTIDQASGVVPETGIVSIGVSAACTVELFIYSPVMGWVHPSSGSAGYSKTFTEAAFDFFTASPGDRFCVKASVGSITGYTDGDRVGGVNHG